jgi:hypothetical protein
MGSKTSRFQVTLIECDHMIQQIAPATSNPALCLSLVKTSSAMKSGAILGSEA